MRGLARSAALIFCLCAGPLAADPAPPKPDGAIRVATFNAALSRRGAGELIVDLRERDAQPAAVVAIIRQVRPDILVLNEIDRDPEGLALAALRNWIAEEGGPHYPDAYQGRVNTGKPSGLDLDGDGRTAGPDDAWGWGRFPGQYGMAVLSRFPLGAARSYRQLRWSAMPGADRPMADDGTPFHPDEIWRALRLSSKAHWIVPVKLPGGTALNLIAAHPTPPVFDGPEDRNGRRNADEIRLIAAIIDDAAWLTDDAGDPGGLAPDAPFVVAGDLNADPFDGEGRHDAIAALLAHPHVQDPRPASHGAGEAAARQGGANERHRGPAAEDTADWNDTRGDGNLRVDYVLPSAGLEILGSGVFWPMENDPLSSLVAGGRDPASSDHRLVWVDLKVAP